MTAQLEVVSQFVALPGATLTRTALIIDPSATDAQVARIGEALIQIDGSRCWWIGDYGCALQQRRGEHYTEGQAEVLGIHANVFRQYKMVAAFFNPLCRHNDLSFGHHYEAMGGSNGDLAIAQDWLDKTKENNWSVSELRKAVRVSRSDYKNDDLPPSGNGYSALLDADRWASSQLKEISTYTPVRAAAILSDIERLVRLLDELRIMAKGAHTQVRAERVA
jgi:hypothetical protein